MIAVMRFYRRSYRFLIQGGPGTAGLAPPKGPQLAPTLYFHEEPMTDSTKIIARLEAEGTTGRSLMPSDPALAFFSKLIEDFADEWCTKMMYHYRWDEEAEQKKAAAFLFFSMNPAAPEEQAITFQNGVKSRQVGRRDVVGSNANTKATIEGDFLRLVELLDRHLASGAVFLFGRRPSQADFALFGQLMQLWTVENRSRMLLEGRSMRVAGWLALMTDLSGLSVSESDWHTSLSPTAAEIVREVGRHYAPFLLANSEALARKLKRVEAKMPDGTQWSQPSFPYQAKCLEWLREDYRSLGSAKAIVDDVLFNSGAEHLFTAPKPNSKL